jgi:glycosyltransferase involved in cell wall biosynthesis
MMSVSVAMATYNGQKYLDRQLESLAGQIYPPAELVVTDDASEDRTLSIIEDFSRRSPFPVRIWQNTARIGYRKNFMQASSLCRSDLIAFCDQDDRWYPNKIATCVELFGNSEILLVYHNADVVSSDGAFFDRLEEFAAKHSVSLPSSVNPMSHAMGFTQMFRRTMVQFSALWQYSLDHNHPDQPMAHDQWFFFLASVFGQIAYVDEPLAAYVQHGDNAFGWRATMQPLRKVISALWNPADQYSCRAKYVESLIDILHRASGDLASEWRERADAAVEKYAKLSKIYQARSTIYKSPRLRDRLRAFLDVLAGGGYHGSWALGSRSLLKDICLGIPIGPFLIRSNGQ